MNTFICKYIHSDIYICIYFSIHLLSTTLSKMEIY